MGYFKNEQVASQADVDRIVSWYRFHDDKGLYKYLAWAVADDARLWSEIRRWESQPWPPKRAVDHVALWPNRDHIRRERRALSKANRESSWAVVGFIVLLGVIGAALVYALEVL